MNPPRVSVIVPCLNAGLLLERALCSVQDQGIDHLELIVVDGGSDGETAAVLDNYALEIDQLLTGTYDTPAAAINAGLDAATGDLVGVLHATDLLLPGALETIVRAADRDDPPAWIVARGLRLGEADESLGALRMRAPEDLADLVTNHAGPMTVSGSFFDRAALIDAGGFDADLRHAHAFELACRLTDDGHTPVVLDGSLVGHREHRRGRSAKQVLAFGREFLAVARRYSERLPLPRRVAAWPGLDERERVYAIAESECKASASRAYLWGQLLRHPWWLADDHFRRSLLHDEPLTEADLRQAA